MGNPIPADPVSSIPALSGPLLVAAMGEVPDGHLPRLAIMVDQVGLPMVATEVITTAADGPLHALDIMVMAVTGVLVVTGVPAGLLMAAAATAEAAVVLLLLILLMVTAIPHSLSSLLT